MHRANDLPMFHQDDSDSVPYRYHLPGTLAGDSPLCPSRDLGLPLPHNAPWMFKVRPALLDEIQRTRDPATDAISRGTQGQGGFQGAHEIHHIETVRRRCTIKVSLRRPGMPVVHRRLSVPFDFDYRDIPLHGYRTAMTLIGCAFSHELNNAPVNRLRLGYVDDDGDEIVVSSDEELSMALDHGTNCTVQLLLTPISVEVVPQM